MHHPPGHDGRPVNRERRLAIRRTLVGGLPDGSIVVATPIRSMFRLFGTHGWTDVPHDGWWPRMQSGRVHAVLIPQGGAVADLCSSLAGMARFDLLGYGGSLVPWLDVGSVVQPGSASLAGDHRTFPLSRPAEEDSPPLVTVPHLLATYEAAADPAGTVVVADMECAYAAAALDLVGGPVPGARLVITDRWPDAPFYKTGCSTADRISMTRTETVASLVADLHQDGML